MSNFRVWHNDPDKPRYLSMGEFALRDDSVILKREGRSQKFVTTTDVEDIFIEKSTGLKDKNGVEIYANDYIGNETTYKLLVAIEKGHTIVKFKDSNINYTEMITQEEIDDQWFYVLGNIHEDVTPCETE